MRWLFLIVLFLNLAYIGWHTIRPVTQSYENVQPLKNVSPIVLLSELKQQQAQVAAIAQTSSLQNDEVNKPQQAPILAEANSEKQQPPPLPLQIVEAVEAVEAVETTETAPDKKPEEIKQPALTSDKDEVAAEKVANIKPIKTSNELKERCFTLGPFRDLDRLSSLTREIKPYVVSTDFRGREERQQTLYWVYIQPKKNNKKAVATGKRLRAKKIKDFFVIREGEKKYGLSLGHFRNKNGAYGLAKKVKNLGFDVVVEPEFETFTVYWLDYQLADGASIPEALFEQYTKSTKKGKVSRLSRSCGP